jgi:hypothetical protein
MIAYNLSRIGKANRVSSFAGVRSSSAALLAVIILSEQSNGLSRHCRILDIQRHIFLNTNFKDKVFLLCHVGRFVGLINRRSRIATKGSCYLIYGSKYLNIKIL